MSSSVDNNHTDTTTTVNNEQKQQTDVNIKQVQSLLQIVQHSAAGPHIERTNILQMLKMLLTSATSTQYDWTSCCMAV